MAMSQESMNAAIQNAGLGEPGQTSPEVAETQAGPERPASSANRDAWADYVSELGGDPEGMTIAELKAEADRLTA